MSYLLIVNIITLIVFIFAFITAEAKGKIILAIITALLFILPRLFPFRGVEYSCSAGKIIFTIGCYLYLRMHGFFKR
jgi:membrane protein YdbS with pleckstrin-like domain